MKILFLTPSVEEHARGIGYILRCLVASAIESGHECGVLCGYPMSNKIIHDRNADEQIILQKYFEFGDRMFSDLVPGGLRRKNLVKSFFRRDTFNVREVRPKHPSQLSIPGLSFTINAPFFYQYLIRNYSRVTRQVIKKITKQFNIDLVVAVSPTILRSTDVYPAKLIHFVHDIIPLEMDDIHQSRVIERFRDAILNSISYSDQVLVNSEDTAKKIAKVNASAAEKCKIKVMYGISSTKEIEGDDYLSIRFGVKKKQFLFFLSALEPRKNIINLIKAYTFIADKITMPLLLAGQPGEGFEKVYELHNSLPKMIRKRILFVGRITEKEKALLYRDAYAFVFPSFYEGLGLGVIEAMQGGCPVISSRCGGLQEACGDAALFIDNPHDPNDIAEKIMRLMNDQDLYQELVHKGKNWSQNFTFEKFQARFNAALADLGA